MLSKAQTNWIWSHHQKQMIGSSHYYYELVSSYSSGALLVPHRVVRGLVTWKLLSKDFLQLSFNSCFIVHKLSNVYDGFRPHPVLVCKRVISWRSWNNSRQEEVGGAMQQTVQLSTLLVILTHCIFNIPSESTSPNSNSENINDGSLLQASTRESRSMFFLE